MQLCAISKVGVTSGESGALSLGNTLVNFVITRVISGEIEVLLGKTLVNFVITGVSSRAIG